MLRSNVTRFSWATLIFAVLSATTAVKALDRTALWLVVRSCAAAKATLGTALPCLEVKSDQGLDPGVAVLRVPLASTHLLVVPTKPISGLESPSLRLANSGRYWQAAWDARRYILDDVQTARPPEAIGMAANSKFVRSQDQFHIHVDCVQASVQRILGLKAGVFERNWSLLPFPIEGQRYYGRRIASGDLADTNLVGSLMKEQPAATDYLPALTVAVIGMPSETGQTVFFALAGQAHDPFHGAELLLDHSCSAPTIGRN